MTERKVTMEEMDAFLKDIRILIDGEPCDCRKAVDAIRATLNEHAALVKRARKIFDGKEMRDTPWKALDLIRDLAVEEED